MPYTKLLYHIVFSTKDRKKALVKTHKKQLFQYIWGIIENKNGHLYRLNGVEDHIHILVGLRPNMTVSNIVKDIKVNSTNWIKEKGYFPKFKGWQVGYGAFTVSEYEKDGLIEYIKNQEEHHKTVTFEEEYRRLLKEHGIEFEEKYLF
ncbi:MAG: IS200/IS605 family transposase [Saprospiraceae bacterium]